MYPRNTCTKLDYYTTRIPDYLKLLRNRKKTFFSYSTNYANCKRSKFCNFRQCKSDRVLCNMYPFQSRDVTNDIKRQRSSLRGNVVFGLLAFHGYGVREEQASRAKYGGKP